MKLGLTGKTALGALLATVLLAAGCAYTTIPKANEVPALGPPVHTGQKAVMPEVKDMRVWPVMAPDTPIVDVRLFADQITDHLRRDLLQRGLFTALPAPEQAGALETDNQLLVTVQAFRLAKEGYNAWVIPHLVADGLVLPVFGAVAVASKGEIDMGAYLIPSTKMGTTIQAAAEWKEGRFTILQRSYLVLLPLGSVSERRFKETMSEPLTHGAAVGKTEGVKTLDKLAEAMSRDPYWAYLNQFKRIYLAERAGGTNRPLDRRVEATQGVLDIIKPLAFAPEVAGVLRDGALEPKMRAEIINDTRARRLGLEDAKSLPADQQMDEKKVKALFDDPAVERALVEAELLNRVLALAIKVLTPPAPAKPAAKEEKAAPPAAGPPSAVPPAKKEEAKPMVVEPANAAQLRAGLRQKLADSLKGKPHVEVLLLAQADKAVGQAWAPMLSLLKEMDSPQVKEYLKRRQL